MMDGDMSTPQGDMPMGDDTMATPGTGEESVETPAEAPAEEMGSEETSTDEAPMA